MFSFPWLKKFKYSKAAKDKYKFSLGVYYQGIREVYHKNLYGDLNPANKSLSREKILQKKSRKT